MAGNLDDELGGRRSGDRYPGPEAVGVLLVQIRADVAELKADLKEGFAEFRREFDQIEKRVNALERFRERVEERDRAVAASEGTLSVRWPAIAAILTTLALVASILTAIATH